MKRYKIYEANTKQLIGEAELAWTIWNSANGFAFEWGKMSKEIITKLDLRGLEVIHDNEDIAIGGYGLASWDDTDPDKPRLIDRYILVPFESLISDLECKIEDAESEVDEMKEYIERLDEARGLLEFLECAPDLDLRSALADIENNTEELIRRIEELNDAIEAWNKEMDQLLIRRAGLRNEQEE